MIKKMITKAKQILMLKANDFKPKVLKAITDDSYTQKQEELLDDTNKVITW